VHLYNNIQMFYAVYCDTGLNLTNKRSQTKFESNLCADNAELHVATW